MSLLLLFKSAPGVTAVSAADAATVAQAAALGVGLSATDSAVLANAFASSAAVQASAAAALTESATAVALAAQHSSTFAEQLAIAVTTGDAHTVSELAAVAVAFNAGDTGALTEVISTNAPTIVPATDTATVTEAASVALSATDAATVSDVGFGPGFFDTGVFDDGAFDGGSGVSAAIGLGATEVVGVTEAAAAGPGFQVLSSQPLSLLDQATISVSPAIDTAALAEAFGAVVATGAADQATVTEQVQIALSSADGAGLAERAAMALIFGDQAALADIAAVSAVIAAVEAVRASDISAATPPAPTLLQPTEQVGVIETAAIYVLPQPPTPIALVETVPGIGVALATSPYPALTVVSNDPTTPPVLVGSAH